MKKLFFTLLIVFITSVFSFAQEGMWLLNQIDKLNLKDKGLKIEVTDIYNTEKPALHNAIVQLGGGTASFVSPDGLLLTNHHVAFGAIQRASSVNTDYLTNGFLALNRSEEIQAQGYRAQVLIEMKDVTADIQNVLKGIIDPLQLENLKNQKISEITTTAKQGKDDINAIVSEMYEGRQYILFVYKVFKDVRIVYCPPMSIGKYGGEIDNWMWPRHTGDFSFLRVYMAPDGTGKEYDPNNIPYKPKVWLKVSNEDLKDGDFTFIVGFPGTTTRYRSSNSVYWNLNYNYPFSIKNFSEIIELMDNLTKNDKEGKLKVASLKSGLSNALKNYQGKVDGMKKTNFLQKKYEFENEFINWINSNPQRKQKYGDFITEEKEQYTILEKTREKNNVIGLLQGLSGIPMSNISQAYYIIKELEKPAAERVGNVSERTLQQISANSQFAFANFYEPVDKALLIRMLKMVNDLPQSQRINGLEYIFSDKSKTIEQFVDDAYSKTKLTDAEYFKTVIAKTSKEIESIDDPFIKIAVNIYPEFIEYIKNSQSFSANVTFIRKKYMEALYEWKGTGLYPDANGTMRFTYGNVKGYSPADAVWYYPFTTFKGVIAKNTGKEPFDAPSGLIQLYNNKNYGKWIDPELKDVPVAFLHQCDITGGNSGSPVLNAKGELIGLVFDGNYEGMISDWQYDYDLQRVISVDIRYVLFITEKFGNGGYILDEMKVKH